MDSGPSIQGGCEANPTAVSPKCDGEPSSEGEVTDSTLPGKTSKERHGCPYRKPTRVDGENIPRPSR